MIGEKIANFQFLYYRGVFMDGVGLLIFYIVMLAIAIFLAVRCVKKDKYWIGYVFGIIAFIVSFLKYAYYDTHPHISGSHFEIYGFRPDKWLWSVGATMIFLVYLVVLTIFKIISNIKRQGEKH